MAALGASSAQESSSDPAAGQTGPQLVPLNFVTVDTSSRLIDAASIAAFVTATGDDNPIHLDDAVARAIPLLGLNHRIAHGKLVQSVAIDLLRRVERTLRPEVIPVIVEETWRFALPVYVDEEVRVRYKRPGNLRINRRVTFELQVYVRRNDTEFTVQTGAITAMPLRLKAS